MRLRVLILLLALLPLVSAGQSVSDSLLADFYNQTLSYYFLNPTNHSTEKHFRWVLIKTNFDQFLLTKTIGKKKLKYFGDKTDIVKVLSKPLKRNRGRSIYSVSHTIIHLDTIDININGQTIEKASKKMIGIAVWCGGSMGYIPDGRFVRDQRTNKWTFSNADTLMRQKAEALRRRFILRQPE